MLSWATRPVYHTSLLNSLFSHPPPWARGRKSSNRLAVLGPQRIITQRNKGKLKYCDWIYNEFLHSKLYSAYIRVRIRKNHLIVVAKS